MQNTQTKIKEDKISKIRREIYMKYVGKLNKAMFPFTLIRILK